MCSTLSRRSKALLAAIAFCGCVFAAAARSSFAADRPNVLLIIGDDHAPYVFGAYGAKQAKTPNLDKLAASGMRFDRAFCNSPVCTASRQSFLTGRLPHSIGVTQLRTALGEEPVTLAELFKSAGYATAAFGKMHFNQKLRPGLHGFDELCDRGEAEGEIRARGSKPVDQAVAVQPPWRPFQDPASVWLNSANRPIARHIEDMPGTLFADRAIKFMEQKKGEPFFLVASFTEPHSPFEYPVEFAGMFDPKDFDPPEPGPEDDAQIPEIFRGLTREEKQGITAAYHTSAAFLDACAGRVLDGLEKLGLAEKTIVVYVGDHGYCLGHHGRFEKHCMFEPAVRAPLVVRWPGRARAGSATMALVELIDLFPTLAQICGVEAPKEVEGRSLLPILTGAAKEHRDLVFCEYSENEEAMLRGARHKLVYGSGKRERQDGYATGRPLPGRTVKLFDLEADAGELRNLANDPAQAERVARMERAMIDRYGAILQPVGQVSYRLAGRKETISAPTSADVLDFLVGPPEERKN